MDSITVPSNDLSAVADTSQTAASYLPEPAVTGVGAFRDVMDVLGNAAGTVGSGLLAGTGLSTGSFEGLIMLQLQAQEQMQTTSMVSNIEKSKHESQMAAIRNIRVG